MSLFVTLNYDVWSLQFIGIYDRYPNTHTSGSGDISLHRSEDACKLGLGWDRS